MPRKKDKTLPNYRGRGLSVIASHPGDGGLLVARKDAEWLARKHHFLPEYDLLSALDGAIEQYLMDASYQDGKPTHTEEREYLEAVAERAKLLEEALNGLHLGSQGKIHHHWPTHSTQTGWFYRMRKDTRALKQATERALKYAPPARRGRPQDVAEKEFFTELQRIYGEGTGRSVVPPYWNENIQNYSGPTLEFVLDVITVVPTNKLAANNPPTKSRTAVAKALRRLTPSAQK